MTRNPGGTSAAPDRQFNDADVLFLQRMIPHHEQALTMATALTGAVGVGGEVVSLAERISRRLPPEIDRMRRWLAVWDQPMAAAPGDSHTTEHDGMASPDQIRSLRTTDPSRRAQLFLQLMLTHHHGAVALAEAEVTNGTNRDAVALAGTITRVLTDEIAVMTDLQGGRR